MSVNSDISTMNTLIFISGAGTGFGRACALTAAKIFQNNSLLLICGRNLQNLNETKLMVQEINSTISIEVFRLDLENINEHETKAILNQIMKLDKFPYELFLLIHNAGILGDVTKLSYQYTDKTQIQSLTDINFIGTVIVNNILLDIIKDGCNRDKALILLVNVSSLAAVKPLPLCSLYGAVKASREMFFRCLSTEWSKSESIKLFVLNYAPGPMDTDMLKTLLDVIELKGGDDILNPSIEILAPSMSSDKLFYQILLNYSLFESGSRLDYYDL